METIASQGTFTDVHGTEPLTWTIRPHPNQQRTPPSFEIVTTIRGTRITGCDFEALAPVIDEGQQFELDVNGYLLNYEVTGSLPLHVRGSGGLSVVDVDFVIPVGPHPPGRAFQERGGYPAVVSATIDGVTYRAVNSWSEGCFDELLTAMAKHQVECCWTCLLSDYHPGGVSGLDMSCHREVSGQYLSVRSKADYLNVPITETVPEYHHCEHWRERPPNTGYRG